MGGWFTSTALIAGIDWCSPFNADQLFCCLWADLAVRGCWLRQQGEAPSTATSGNAFLKGEALEGPGAPDREQDKSMKGVSEEREAGQRTWPTGHVRFGGRKKQILVRQPSWELEAAATSLSSYFPKDTLSSCILSSHSLWYTKITTQYTEPQPLS